MCVRNLIVLYFATTAFDVQHNCLLRFTFGASPTSQGVVMLQTRLNHLKHRNPLNGPLVLAMVPGFKVHL